MRPGSPPLVFYIRGPQCCTVRTARAWLPGAATRPCVSGTPSRTCRSTPASGTGTTCCARVGTIYNDDVVVLLVHSHFLPLSPVWSPDGLTFVSADKSGEIRLWDPKTGTAKVPLRPVLPSLLLPSFLASKLPLSPDVPRQGQPLRGHKKWVTSLAFEPLHADPTCTRLASSSKDHTVRQSQPGRCTYCSGLLIHTHYRLIAQISCCPIFFRLTAVLVQIKVWNLRTGACETTISGHTDSVECVRWGGVGLLYTCSRDRTIKVWAIDGSGTQNSPILDASFQRSRATTPDNPSHTRNAHAHTHTHTHTHAHAHIRNISDTQFS